MPKNYTVEAMVRVRYAIGEFSMHRTTITVANGCEYKHVVFAAMDMLQDDGFEVNSINKVEEMRS